MRSRLCPGFCRRITAVAIATLAIGSPVWGPVSLGSVARAADKQEVIAVVAVDPYADLRSQLTWVGEQVGNPTLAGFAESFILLATQGKGLAGLDVKRPVGVVITTEGGPLPTAHAFVPVKDLDKLLGAIQGMIGPVDEVDGVRRISPPGAPPFEIIEKDGWAILSQPGSPAEIADPLAVIEPLSKNYSIAIELFPSRMPADMQERLRDLLDEASRNAAAQGQPMNDEALRAGIDQLDQIEKLIFGVAIDTEKDDIHLDITSVLEADAAAAASWKNAGNAVSTIVSPAAADGRQAAVRGHSTINVPAEGRAAVRVGLDQALEQADDDPTMRVVANLVRDLVAAMLDTGAIDAGFTIDTSAADAKNPLPAVTIGMKVEDGEALQKKVKERLSKADALPPQVKIAFDTGKEGPATLHEITIDVSETPAADRLGESVKLTLAVTPDHAWLLTGGDVKQRLAKALAGGGKPVADTTSLADIDVSLAAVIGYAAKMAALVSPDESPTDALPTDALGEVAKQAAEKDSTRVQFSMMPIDRGLTLRLSADAGALQTIAASTALQPGIAPARPMAPVRPLPRRRPEQEAAPSIAP
jgi:hypothetical protein